MIPIDALLANEQMIRVFPARTNWTPQDNTTFVGDPPFPQFRPADRKTAVRISVTFTWHKREAERLARSWARFYDDVLVGGPAYGDPGGEFTPGRFLKHGCTITSRGCPKRCGWCVVPKHEGELRLLQVKPGWIVQDNNLLACPISHLHRVFEMLRAQKRAAHFNGGLDKHFLTEDHRKLFDSIRIGEMWFACDTSNDLPALHKAARILDGISIEKLRCYVLIGYDGEAIADAERRLEAVYEYGFLPFCQLYQPDETKTYPIEWRKLHRKWSRPAAYRRAS